MLVDALKKEILSNRALDFKRNSIAIGALLGALYLFPSIDLSGLTFFGVKPTEGGNAARHLVLKVTWLLLAYHFFFFAYYAWRDFRLWWMEASEPNVHLRCNSSFPEWPMFFGFPPRKQENKRQDIIGDLGEKWEKIAPKDEKMLRWKPVVSKDQMAVANFYQLPSSLVRRFQEKFLWFSLVDIGAPTLILVGNLILTINEYWRNP